MVTFFAFFGLAAPFQCTGLPTFSAMSEVSLCHYLFAVYEQSIVLAQKALYWTRCYKLIVYSIINALSVMVYCCMWMDGGGSLYNVVMQQKRNTIPSYSCNLLCNGFCTMQYGLPPLYYHHVSCHPNVLVCMSPLYVLHWQHFLFNSCI